MRLLYFLDTSIGRFRLIGLLEGVSLVVLLFIAVPIKYINGNPLWVKTIGPIHGAFFILYAIMSFQIASEQNWKFSQTTWKVLLSSFLPFGTFYIDHVLLKNIEPEKKD
jgi:integral membrane protein